MTRQNPPSAKKKNTLSRTAEQPHAPPAPPQAGSLTRRASSLRVTAASGPSEIASDSVSIDPVLISMVGREVQSISELANSFPGELDFLGVSRERTPHVISDLSSCGDAIPQPSSSSQSSSGPFSDARSQVFFWQSLSHSARNSGMTYSRHSWYERSKARERTADETNIRPSGSGGNPTPTTFQEPPPEDFGG